MHTKSVMVGPRFEFLARADDRASSHLRCWSVESPDSGPTLPVVEPMHPATLARFRLALPTKIRTRSCTQPPSLWSKDSLYGIFRQENTLGRRDGEFRKPLGRVTTHQSVENQPDGLGPSSRARSSRGGPSRIRHPEGGARGGCRGRLRSLEMTG